MCVFTDFWDNGCDCWPLRLVYTSFCLYCIVWRREDVYQKSPSYDDGKMSIFGARSFYVFIFVCGDEVTPLINRNMKRCFLKPDNHSNAYSSVTVILNFGSDLMLPYLTVHVVERQNRFHWQIQKSKKIQWVFFWGRRSENIQIYLLLVLNMAQNLRWLYRW